MAGTSSVDPVDMPAMTPPAGVQPNFVNPPSLEPLSIAVIVLCLSLTLIALCIKLFTKLWIKSLRIEDWLAVGCWAILATYCGVVPMGIKQGVGRHPWDVTVAQLESILEFVNLGSIFYGPSVYLAKASVLLQLQHIFVPNKRTGLWWMIQMLLWVNLTFYLADTLVQILQCLPREKIWNPSLPGTCINSYANFIATGSLNVVSDFTILLLPAWSIWHLHLPLKRKLTVSAVFATGLFACISSLTRTIYTVKLLNTADVTWVLMEVGLWTLAEVTTVLLCACFPVFPRFFQIIRHREPRAHSLREYRRSYRLPSGPSSSQTKSTVNKRARGVENMEHKPTEIHVSGENVGGGTRKCDSADRVATHSDEEAFPLRSIQKTVCVEMSIENRGDSTSTKATGEPWAF